MSRFRLIFLFLVCLIFSDGTLTAQEWEFIKEKDGISVYTRHETESNFNSFRGEVEFKADMTTVCALIEDVKNFDRWDEDVSEIRVLEQVEGKMIKYYVSYDVPWPVKDRDLCVEALITRDDATRAVLILARSVPEAVPQNEDLVRIVDYRQKWIIQPKENGLIHLTVEGFADPAGDVPAWIVNMAITDTPFNMLMSIKDAVEEPKDTK